MSVEWGRNYRNFYSFVRNKCYPTESKIFYNLSTFHFGMFIVHIKYSFLVFVCRELIRCLKWYMDRSAEVVRQDHIQDAMRVSSMLDHLKLVPNFCV